MQQFDAFIRRISTVAVWSAGAVLILCAIGVSVEVILRRVFVVSVGGATEYSGYALALISSWSFAYTLLHRKHVRIDTLYRLFPRPVRIGLDFLAIVCLFGFMGVVSYRALHVLLVSIKNDTISTTPLATPMWIPQSLWLFGLGLFLAVALYLLILSGRSLIRGEFDKLESLIGAGDEAEAVQEYEELAETALQHETASTAEAGRAR